MDGYSYIDYKLVSIVKLVLLSLSSAMNGNIPPVDLSCTPAKCRVVVVPAF